MYNNINSGPQRQAENKKNKKAEQFTLFGLKIYEYLLIDLGNTKIFFCLFKPLWHALGYWLIAKI